MPQMAPTMWMMLFIFTLTMIFIILSLLYFSNNVKLNMALKNKNFLSSQKIWSW